MNISPISANNTNNYSTKKLNNPNFKQVTIQTTEGTRYQLRNRAVYEAARKMAETLKRASSQFFDSVITIGYFDEVRFFMKFKENFKWPSNEGEGIYTSRDYKDIDELQVPEEHYKGKHPICLRYKDDKGIQHSCKIDTYGVDYVPRGNYEIRYEKEDGPYTAAEDAVKLDEMLTMMQNGDIYGREIVFYPLKWHPFPENETETNNDIEFNKSTRKHSAITTEEEIDALLNKYGK